MERCAKVHLHLFCHIRSWSYWWLSLWRFPISPKSFIPSFCFSSCSVWAFHLGNSFPYGTHGQRGCLREAQVVCAFSCPHWREGGWHPIWHSIPQPGGQFVLVTTFTDAIAILGFLTVHFRFQKFFLHNSQIVVASISRDIMDVNSSIQRATVGQQIHHLWPWGLPHHSHPFLLGHTFPFFLPLGSCLFLG